MWNRVKYKDIADSVNKAVYNPTWYALVKYFAVCGVLLLCVIKLMLGFERWTGGLRALDARVSLVLQF